MCWAAFERQSAEHVETLGAREDAQRGVGMTARSVQWSRAATVGMSRITAAR